MSNNIRITTGFRSFTDEQLANVAAAAIKGMTGNKAFPNPPVDPTAVQSALDEYLAALAATIQGGTTATATKNNKRDVLTDFLQKLAYYVQSHCVTIVRCCYPAVSLRSARAPSALSPKRRRSSVSTTAPEPNL